MQAIILEGIGELFCPLLSRNVSEFSLSICKYRNALMSISSFFVDPPRQQEEDIE